MKQKTKKAASKRFKITAGGKIVRRRQMASHLKQAKSKSAKTRYKQVAYVARPEKKRVERLLSYS